MSAAVVGAYIAALGGLAATVAAGLLGRRPQRSLALDEMQASLAARAGDVERLEGRCTRQEARIDALEDEVASCEQGRAEDRARFSRELAELRRTIRALTDREQP